MVQLKIILQPLARGWEKGVRQEAHIQLHSVSALIPGHQGQTLSQKRSLSPQAVAWLKLSAGEKRAQTEIQWPSLSRIQRGFGPGAQGPSQGQLTCILWLQLPADFLEQKCDMEHGILFLFFQKGKDHQGKAFVCPSSDQESSGHPPFGWRGLLALRRFPERQATLHIEA